jgi:heme-degrading monooxygenase HmoA
VSEKGFRDEFLNDVRQDLAGLISPDLWKLSWSLMNTPTRRRIAVDLMEGLEENLTWFPRYQEYLREHQPPALIVWGPQDGYMPEPAASAYLRDLPDAEMHLLEVIGYWKHTSTTSPSSCGPSWTESTRGLKENGMSHDPKHARIARIWRGRTRRERADEYEAYNYEVGIKPLIEKALGVQTLREDRHDETEFITISYWESIEAMSRFTGGDPTRIHHLNRDEEFLIELPQRVQVLHIRASHGNTGGDAEQ